MNKIIQEIKCGLHSGFPWCCVSYFILIWRWVPNSIRIFNLDQVGYIRCPFCETIERKIEVKPCDCGNKESLEEEFEIVDPINIEELISFYENYWFALWQEKLSRSFSEKLFHYLITFGKVK